MKQSSLSLSLLVIPHSIPFHSIPFHSIPLHPFVHSILIIHIFIDIYQRAFSPETKPMHRFGSIQLAREAVVPTPQGFKQLSQLLGASTTSPVVVSVAIGRLVALVHSGKVP